VLCEQLKADPIVRTVTIDMIGLSNGRPAFFHQ
jgi:hypothetical protein